jgi:hypothetical protein
MSRLLSLSEKVLRDGAVSVCGSDTFDARGYCVSWRSNLIPSYATDGIEIDLLSGAGSELNSKFLAAYSSSALAVNAFGWWREYPSLFQVGNRKFNSLRFEARCSSGLGGTPPHLDVLAIGAEVFAVESKCTEWMRRKTASFVSSYDQLAIRWAGSPWVKLMLLLKKQPQHFQHLDAAQLIKHAFGLMHTFPNTRPTLLYLFWEPLNSSSWIECAKHRKEIAELANFVEPGTIEFVSKSYAELWAEGWFSTHSRKRSPIPPNSILPRSS